MSRIIITNLPKFTTETQLTKHFANTLGPITDCKIVRDQNGVSRKFGFIGFKDPNAAALALKNYDKTYIGVSKIRVEKAKLRGQEEQGRNWKKGKDRNNNNNSNSNNKDNKNNSKSNDKKLSQNQQKFDQYKKIVQEGFKKSWDDLVVPQSAKAATKQDTKTKTAGNNKSNLAKQKQNNNKNVAMTAGKSKKQQKLQKKNIKNQQKNNTSSQQIKPIKAPKLSEKNKKYLTQPLTVDSHRLYVTNLPYNITEQEVKKQFAKFGTIKKLKLPVQYDGKCKGYGFVTYQLPQEALRAFSETDNKVLFGRIVHVKPAVQDIGEIIKIGREADFEQKKLELYGDGAGDGMQQKTSFKKQKKRQMRQKLNDTTSWNTLFLNPNTILQHISAKLGIQKSQILLSQNLAPKLALAQTEIIQETKQWMVQQGLNIQFLKLDRQMCERAEKVLLVKNLNFRTTQHDLRQLFQFYGIVERILLAPNRAIAIVQFSTKQFAGNALQKLQNTKFKNNFLYLEYAPIDMLNQKTLNEKIQKMQQEIQQTEQLSKVVYIKNLNFETSQQILKEFLAKTQEPRSVKIVRDKSGKSMGYGFAEFGSNQAAINIIKKLQNQILDGHKLILSISKKSTQAHSYQKIKSLKQKLNKKQIISNKLVVRNLAFQATKNDVRELFKHFGSIKQIRLPKKMNGQHRGFGFVQYESGQDAALAMGALADSHLYGRKLVIQYEKGNDSKQNN